jgi:hypothetical protein
MLACRHADGQMHAHAAPRLQELTEITVTNILANPRAYRSMETVQALLILAVWPPTWVEMGIRDGRRLISIAVDMALDLRLHESSSEVLRMRGIGSDLLRADIDSMIVRAHVVGTFVHDS